MATKLTKPVRRETAKTYSGREVIITLAPAGSQSEALIGLRLKGKRTQYVCALSDIYRMAALWHGSKEAKARKAARQQGIPCSVREPRFCATASLSPKTSRWNDPWKIQAGGKLGGMLILKVNKSTVTGRATSVSVLRKEHLTGWQYKGSNIAGTQWSEHQIDTERLAPGSYSEPTPESLEELANVKAAIKSAAPKGEPCPLINPTDADADRLQALWNEWAKSEMEQRVKRGGGYTMDDFKPSEVLRIPQAKYSFHSKGSYASASTRGVFKSGIMQELYYNAAEKMRAKYGREVCQVRQASAGNYLAHRVIILTDKPQKPLPAAVWQPLPAQPELITA